ncbi:MAG: hypothetical protein WCD79_18465 [Chthoniobacteraceae bacterium]
MFTDYSFTTLALGKPYRDMAKTLAGDLSIHAPGKLLIVATDAVEDFKGCDNIRAYAHTQRGAFTCWNDKRFAVALALKHHSEGALFYDADSRIVEALPDHVDTTVPLTTDWCPNLKEQTEEYLGPRPCHVVLQTCARLGLDPAAITYVDDNIYMVRKDNGRERVFFETWGSLAAFFDFQGVVIPDGTCMGMAAAIVGWTPSDSGLEKFAHCRKHIVSGGAKLSPRDLRERVTRRLVHWWKWQRHRRCMLAELGR